MSVVGQPEADDDVADQVEVVAGKVDGGKCHQGQQFHEEPCPPAVHTGADTGATQPSNGIPTG